MRAKPPRRSGMLGRAEGAVKRGDVRACSLWRFAVESAVLKSVYTTQVIKMLEGTARRYFVSSDSQLEQGMYAVFVSGGKQHRVVEGETLKLEKIEVATGEAIDFDEVLMVADGDDIKIGAPTVAGAKVTAEVVSHGRGDKVTIIKFRRRKHSMKRQGHRQWFTEVKITGIKA